MGPWTKKQRFNLRGIILHHEYTAQTHVYIYTIAVTSTHRHTVYSQIHFNKILHIRGRTAQEKT